MSELEEVKQFLKIDYDDEDNTIELLIGAAKEYITNSIREYDSSSSRMKLLLMTLVSSMYENKEYTINVNNEKVRHIIRSMCMQLQLEDSNETPDI